MRLRFNTAVIAIPDAPGEAGYEIIDEAEELAGRVLVLEQAVRELRLRAMAAEFGTLRPNATAGK